MKAWRLNPPVLNIGDGKVLRGRQAKVILHSYQSVKQPPSNLLQALLKRGGF